MQSLRARESILEGGECSSAQKYVDELEELLSYSIPRDKLAAFFTESIQVREIFIHENVLVLKGRRY